MWLLSLFVGVGAALFAVYLWLEVQKLPTKETLRGAVEAYARDALSGYERQIRSIETEWADMYQKFSRLAGRMDKNKALQENNPTNNEPNQPLTRRDILRMSRRI